MAEQNSPAPVAVLPVENNPLEAFRAGLEAREMAPGSVRLYLAALRGLEAQHGPILAVGVDQIRAWFSGMKEAGLAPTTRSSRVAAVREFFSWAVSAGLLGASPFQGQKEFKVRRKDVQIGPRSWTGMEKGTLRALAAYMESPLPVSGRNARLPDGREVRLSILQAAASELRDRALVWTLLASGLRASEAAGLQTSGLSEEDGHTIGRVLGKGGKERPFVLGIAASQAVSRWLSVRDLLAPGSPEPLFVTDLGTPFHPKKVWNIVARVARDAGVKQRLSPHSFRHARADELLERSKGDLALVAETLGHSSLETTRGYLAKNPKLLRGRLAAIGGLD